ncbi:LytR family transcriptional regulator [Megamonas hypermegale]|uniref:LCP family protein n=1 Tax=Megamonas hypermegale TaxID=158847 RepID=UPI000B56DA00|nr:LCP family protein [Megamonas hypermegale]OUO41013.1 LytR family transcriptional regulator [Megamonas hypermegale]
MDKKTDIDTNDKTETNTISNENNTDNTLDLPDTPKWISRKWQEEHSSEKNSSAPKKKYVKKKNYNRLIALIIILVALIGGLIYYLYTNDNEDAAPTVTTQQSNAINIMIMGVDRRADDVGRSDTLMVLTYNPADKKASLLSLPRDTRVHIEKNDYDKINHAYAYGGHELTKKTVEAFLNVPVDYYVMIDVHAFEKIIDAVGGVDIDVEKRMYYEDPWDDDGGLVIDLYPGKQHMDGKTAIQYVRYRDGEGDIGRITRQQKFIKAFMSQIISPSILPKLPEIIQNISSAIQTDMPIDKMISLMTDLPTVQQNGLNSTMVPGKPAYIEDISYWIPDIAKTRQLIAQNMDITLDEAAQKDTEQTITQYEKSLPKGLKMGNIADEETSSTDEKDTKKEETIEKPAPVKNEDITVLVINSSGINGAGAEVADILKHKGFKISSVETGNTSSREHTTITANENELNCFYGMPFTCTIMSGGSPGQATVNIGLDYQK